MASTDQPHGFDRLIEIMAALRAPGSGCPWDLEQTFETIAPYTIEEAYEVADAIEHGELVDLKQELGDLLLQVVYHARLAEEQDAFTIADVVAAICEKMIRRHPHVFGETKISSSDELDGLWQRIKQEEKAAAGKDADETGLLKSVPIGLPALTRSLKLQDEAARVGFDWPSITPVFDKAREELAELEAAVEETSGDGDRSAIEDEYGDFLFVVANMARHLKIDPEQALRRTCGKFTRRFGHIERRLGEQRRRMQDCQLDEMEALWDEAKALEER